MPRQPSIKKVTDFRVHYENMERAKKEAEKKYQPSERKRTFPNYIAARDFARQKEREGFGSLVMMEPKTREYLVEWRPLVSAKSK